MIELECPMCELTIPVELDAVELHCGACAVTLDLVERRGVVLALAA